MFNVYRTLVSKFVFTFSILSIKYIKLFNFNSLISLNVFIILQFSFTIICFSQQTTCFGKLRLQCTIYFLICPKLQRTWAVTVYRGAKACFIIRNLKTVFVNCWLLMKIGTATPRNIINVQYQCFLNKNIISKYHSAYDSYMIYNYLFVLNACFPSKCPIKMLPVYQLYSTLAFHLYLRHLKNILHLREYYFVHYFKLYYIR